MKSTFIEIVNPPQKKKIIIIVGVIYISLFHMEITASVAKCLHQDFGRCYLRLPIFILIHTLPSSARK